MSRQLFDTKIYNYYILLLKHSPFSDVWYSQLHSPAVTGYHCTHCKTWLCSVWFSKTDHTVYGDCTERVETQVDSYRKERTTCFCLLLFTPLDFRWLLATCWFSHFCDKSINAMLSGRVCVCTCEYCLCLRACSVCQQLAICLSPAVSFTQVSQQADTMDLFSSTSFYYRY